MGFVTIFSMSPTAVNNSQTNILVTYGEPPSACLADFDHMTTIADSDQPMLYADARIPKEFLPPECFDPNMFGLEYWVPTREGDIYAFGMTIFQVIGQYPEYSSLFYFAFSRSLQARRRSGI